MSDHDDAENNTKTDVRISALHTGDPADSAELVVISVPARTGRPDVKLTQAEREVAAALLGGVAPRTIAEERGTSLRTVSNQIQSVYRKHGVRSKEELALVLLAGFSQPLD